MSPAVAVAVAQPVVRLARRRSAALPTTARTASPEVRLATDADADAIHALIAEHLAEGHLLPRTAQEIAVHAHRFVVAVADGEIVACADLAPLDRKVAEVRSLIVRADLRSCGTGRTLVEALVARATDAGFERLCAFTHAPGFFIQQGFSIVPHTWLPEKIETDCRSCSQFRQCGQYAVMLSLARTRQSCVPLGSLHG